MNTYESANHSNLKPSIWLNFEPVVILVGLNVVVPVMFKLTAMRNEK